jgi:homocysteine S-methyltransferase
MADYPWTPIVRRRGFALLDGGLATELERHGHSLPTALWSAELLRTHPEAIRRVHDDYLRAGADVVITATYQASFQGFAAAGLDSQESRHLMRLAVALARAATDDFAAGGGNDHPAPLVAASIGPYGAALANGAEYTGDYDVGEQVLRDFHRERLALLESAGADLLAIETLPGMAEARILADLLTEREGPAAWMCFSCRDGTHLSDGSPIAEAAALIREVPRIGAIGINCTHPDFVESLIEGIAKAAPDKDIVVYPNLGELWDANARCWTEDTASPAFAELAERWFHAGARLIGGCCRTTPEIIAATGRHLDRLCSAHIPRRETPS